MRSGDKAEDENEEESLISGSSSINDGRPSGDLLINDISTNGLSTSKSAGSKSGTKDKTSGDKSPADLKGASESGALKDAIIIRRFKPGDLSGAMDLDKEVFGGYDPSIFIAFYEYHPRTTLVAEHSGKVVGFVLGFKHTPVEGRVFWLAVKPGYQNQGVGTRLLITLLRIFRTLGAISATLEVRVSNKKAQSLYLSMGFDMVSICPGYYSDGEAAIIMKRRL